MSGQIKPINKIDIHKICSGQVVLNLTTAVKELIENSLDAGATSVGLKLKEYGKDFVEVTDNGAGIHPDNFEGLALKHHTSKIENFSDLTSVETFGFRGEALSSLCALSEVTVTTRHSSQSCGTKLVFDNLGHIKSKSNIAKQVGTTVTLSNLFSSLPVRHKEFHRNLKKEFGKMIQVVTGYCLVATQVKISCANQTKSTNNVLLSTHGGNTVLENISCIYGSKQANSLLVLKKVVLEDTDSEAANTFELDGYVSSCDHSSGRSSKDRQFYFINSRPCEPLNIIKTVNEVYHQYNQNQYPFIYLNITIARAEVDINVTPDKRKIFLSNENYLISLVKASLNRLYENIPSIYKINTLFESMPNKRPYESNIENTNLKQLKLDLNNECENNKTSISSSEQIRAKFNRWNSNCSKVIATNKIETSNDNQNEYIDDFKEKQIFNSPLKCIQIIKDNNYKNETIVDLKQENVDYDVATVTHTDNLNNTTISSLKCIQIIKDNDDKKETIVELKQKNIDYDVETATHIDNLNNTTIEFAKYSVNNSNEITKNYKHCLEIVDEKQNFIKDIKINLKNDININLSKNLNYESSKIETNESIEVDYSIAPKERKFIIIETNLEQIKQRLKFLTLRKSEKQKTRTRFYATINSSENHQAESELSREISKDMFSKMSIIGQFNLGFIITKLDADLFIVDQHATDEKYNFETLQKTTKLTSQKLVVPQNLDLTAVNEIVLMDNINIFQMNGFDFEFQQDAEPTKKVKLITIPMSKNWKFGKEDVEELLFMLQDAPPNTLCRPSRVRLMFASRACRKSVMIGTVLNINDMRKLIDHMGVIEQPWNCPHGRPTMRHLVNLSLLNGNQE